MQATKVWERMNESGVQEYTSISTVPNRRQKTYDTQKMCIVNAFRIFS